VKTAGTAFGGAWIAANLTGIEAARAWAREVAASGLRPSFEYLSDDEAALVESFTSRIIPTDETPGAREAHVVYFVDRAFGSSLPLMADVFRAEYPGFVRLVRKRHPEAASFSDLSERDQDALLRSIEGGQLFQILRMMTVFGMFSDPSHGGNLDEIGWRLIGFEDRHMWTPPFGYYDRGHHGGAE